MDMPLMTGLLQLLVHTDGAGLCGTADGKLHGHNGQTQEKQTNDIQQHKSTAAVLAGHPGKFPDIAAADCTSCAQQDESQTGGETITFHKFHLSLFV